MKIEFGLRGHDIADSFEDMCVTAEKNKVKKLQFALAKTVSEVNFDEVGYDAQLSKKIKEKLDSHGLHVSVLGCYIDPVAEDKEFLASQLKRFKNFLYYAKDFSADVIGTETGALETQEKTRSEENYLAFLENFRPIIKEAEKIGVTVGIEPVHCYTIYDPQRMRRFIDDINSPALGVILDVSNMINSVNRHMQSDIINDSFDLFGDKIKAIHLKDFTFDGEEKYFAVAGTGELMTELIFDRIAERGINPEIILDETNLSLYEDSLKALKEIL